MSPIRSVRPAHLSGPRCLLREWVDSDAEALHALTNEPQVADRMLDEHPPSPAEVRAVLPAWRDAAGGEPRLAYHLAAVARDRLVGLGTLTVTSPEHRRGEIGYVVHPGHWGQGLGTEVAGLLLRLAFEQVGLHRVEATTRPDHPASWRVLEKVGMRREGLSRDHLFVRGRWWDSVRYAVLATDR
ncbi:GNAT family N-acetyltransferase [Micromonospora narathiwatensis]|uniref:Protein N-acetyltransferase, RimJ/RimL family n=1 Tax=Micromonospora narathiwatensis TaxID=299146 RepID=A0A1A8Z7E4_9ACTN|nr:GNAT family protein [Micromonospora narathiwatensis]SBT39859.1 Protein N-acetyltransferase, RimJ/RimL family [Micromonospora narathiwatensis]